MFTDGAAKGNPGPGGYGVVLKYGQHRKELTAGYRRTTNNRMELLAVIAGLEALTKDGLDVIIYSDSKYVVDAVTKGWLWEWERKQFKNKKNPDLWKRFIPQFKRQRVKFKWVKGHAGIAENERCDKLAVTSAEGTDLLTDSGFEHSIL